ncbi:MAG: hypothetical protein LBU04_05785 [Christensenellaceae bacterium]|jgi:hypothetical protein|nr:hypothetical protein [Christensenellaceae bacterium]
MKNNTIELELNAIRIAMYEKTKHMNADEYNDYIGKLISPVFKKYGFKSVSRAETKPLNESSKLNGS